MIPILAATLIGLDPIAALGSRYYAEREAAQRICEGGGVSVEALSRGLESPDIEVRWRCSRALLVIAGRPVQGQCPSCDGKGQRRFSGFDWVQCSTCEGVGIVKGRALAAWGAK